MKIILTQAVPGLGEAGTIKEVADGYARNYLLPKKLAVPATRGSVKQAEEQAAIYARKAEKARMELQKGAEAIADRMVKIYARVGSENRLYGSVTAADIAKALKEQCGVTVDRRKVHLEEAIHRTGTYNASVDFGSGVTANVSVEVAPEVAGAKGRATRAGAAEAEAQAEEAAPTMEAPAEATATDEQPQEQPEEEIEVKEQAEEQAEEQVEANPS